MASEIERQRTTHPRTSEHTEQPRGVAEAAAPYDLRTAAVPEDIRRLSAERADGFRALLELAQPVSPEFGQLWTTRPDPATDNDDSDEEVVARLVVVLKEHEDTLGMGQTSVLVLPVSLDLPYQSDRDLLIPADESPSGYSFMIEAWNEVTMLRAQLSRFVGTLPLQHARVLRDLYQAQRQVDLAGDREVIAQAGTELAKYVGPAVTDERDPRIEFQEDEAEACEYLRRPLLQMLSRQIESEETVYEAAPEKVIQFPHVRVERGPLPSGNARYPRSLALAAASERDEADFVRLPTKDGLAVGSLHYDAMADSLYLTWEEFVPSLEGKTVRATVMTKSGQQYDAAPVTARSEERLVLVQGSRLVPMKVDALSFEFEG
jgi:hypothetical protein